MPPITSKQILNEDDAAIRLGITKALLFAYIKNAPKEHLKHTRKLPCEVVGSKYQFLAKDLDDWDKYLHEPWSSPGEKRPAIPLYIKDYLRVESGGQCALCGKGHPLDYAHIDDYSESFSHHHHNIIWICKVCHGADTDRITSKERLKEVKLKLIQKVQRNIQQGNPQVSRKSFHEVPQATNLFVGRDKDLTDLRNRIPEERVIIIEGIGGIGKTQFLAKALEEISDIRTIWFDVESYENFYDLLSALNRVLMSEGYKIQSEESIFDSLNRQPIRIVFDGLDCTTTNDWENVIEFLENLIELTQEPKIIITTQIEITDLPCQVFKMPLKPLSELEGEQLIRLGCKDFENIRLADEHIKWLSDFSDGHALTLKLVTGQLRFHKSSKVVIERLRNSFGASELKSPTRNQQKRKTSLSVCLEATYSNFTHNQKRLLRYIENFPAGCSTIQIKVFQKESDYQLDIAQLKRLFFVEVELDWWNVERFTFLNPVREFIRHEWHSTACDEAGEIQKAAAQNIAEQLLFISSHLIDSSDAQDVRKGLVIIEYDFLNYWHILRYVNWGAQRRKAKGENADEFLEIIYQIGFGLSRYFFMSGMFNQAIPITKLTIDAMIDLGKYGSAVTQYEFLASYQNRIHDREGLKETTENLVALANKISEPEPLAQASLTLGELSDALGKPFEAVEHYKNAASFYQNALQKEPQDADYKDQAESSHFFAVRLGMILRQIGTVYSDLYRNKEALKYLIPALDYTEKSGDHSNLGAAYHQLGNCYSDIGETEKAVTSYLKAFDSFIELRYRGYISNAMGELGCLVSETDFTAELENYFTKEKIFSGLEDINYSVKILLDSNSHVRKDYDLVLRKLFGVIKLISFTSEAYIVKDWLDSFYEEFSLELQLSEADPSNQAKRLFTDFLSAILRLAHIIVDIIDSGEDFTNEFIAELCCNSLDLDEFARENYRPFEWIAALLRYKEILFDAEPYQLRSAIIDAHDSGEGHSAFKLT